ncbi:MAG: hypothetical protein J1F63_07830 [Oscillospiraceae bacterium]|nr:hypothetical protein [Oscillospiraceae bacterium]
MYQEAKPSKKYSTVAEAIVIELLSGDSSLDLINVEIKDIVSYFLRYYYICVEKGENSDCISDITKKITSAPWLGTYSFEYISAIKFLIDNNFLSIVYKNSEYIVHANPNKVFRAKETNNQYKNLIRESMQEIRDRERNIIVDSPKSDKDLYNVIKQHLQFKKNDDLTLKIATYHGKTWFNDPNWINKILDDYPKLKIRILVVGRKATFKVREGASKSTHKKNISNGLGDLSKLYKASNGRIDVRFYGMNDRYSYFRGAIIENNTDGTLIYCNVNFWKFGQERGIYGKSITLNDDSNLALILNNYFNDSFKKAKCSGSPIRKWAGFSAIHKSFIIITIALIFVNIFNLISSTFNVDIINGTFTLIIKSVSLILSIIAYPFFSFISVVISDYYTTHKDIL